MSTTWLCTSEVFANDLMTVYCLEWSIGKKDRHTKVTSILFSSRRNATPTQVFKSKSPTKGKDLWIVSQHLQKLRIQKGQFNIKESTYQEHSSAGITWQLAKATKLRKKKPRNIRYVTRNFYSMRYFLIRLWASVCFESEGFRVKARNISCLACSLFSSN